MATPARLYDVCADLLAAVVANHGGSLPDRVYVSAGAPAWDCELLAVWCERTASYDGDVLYEVGTSIAAGAAHGMRVGTFVVTMVRCTPAFIDVEGGEPVLPTVAAEDAAARLLYEDGQRCLEALVAAEKAGELPGCNNLAFLEWRTLGPEGLLVAGELRVRFGLATGL